MKIQLDLFTHQEDIRPKKNPGRPSEITADKVFAIMNDINGKKFTNKQIIARHGISERSFYRIKAGDQKYLSKFNNALDRESQEFVLSLTD
jgi:hypothetical protein